MKNRQYPRGGVLKALAAAFVLVVAGLPLMSGTVLADTSVSYVSRTWNESRKAVDSTVENQTCQVVESSDSGVGVTWNTGWYAVTKNVTISERITVSGEVNLILCDGATLTASKGIEVADNDDDQGTPSTNILNIYGQNKDSGELVAKTESYYSDADFEGVGMYSDRAAIGGHGNCGTINIYGGKVNATSKTVSDNGKARTRGAGIGGGFGGPNSPSGDCGMISIYGGEVTATVAAEGTEKAECEAAGIGCGRTISNTGFGSGAASNGEITIYGGKVTATVSAKSATRDIANAEGAGIGGGYNNNGVFVGVITIKGGDVTAAVTATQILSNGEIHAQGAGIGEGYGYNETVSYNGGKVFIEGGKIKASSYLGAGIGGCAVGSFNGRIWGADGGRIEITGGTVEATSIDGGAGIGAGYAADGGTIIIRGGDVKATGGKEYGGAGIGGGGGLFDPTYCYGGASGNITITGGSVKAKGGNGASGIGIGHGGTDSTNYPDKKLEISGGTVEATGGDGGAGISIATVEISDTATQPIFAFGGEPNGSDTKGIDGTLNLHVPSALHLMKGTTKNGPWTEIEYASSLPDRFVRLTPYYHVTFNGNGGTGYMSSQSNVEYQTFNLAENAFKKDIFDFNGWNTEADGSGMPYRDRESVTLTGDLTLYAQWIQGKLDTKYKQKIDVKSLLLPIYTSNNPDAVIKKIKFKTSNRKVVKVTKKGIATGGKRSGKATITMYVKTQIIVTNSKGKKKKKTSKWTAAGRLTVENTGKPSKK